jgi:DNA-binding MurR/RpiR family transcriptional regulator
MNRRETSPHDGTVAERIRAVSARLTPAELAVANKLLAKYPMAGLVPIVQLATEAEVSAPTVTRLVSKLGFFGYGDFHNALRAEVQTRMFSPVDVYPGNNNEHAANSIVVARTAYLDAINSTFLHLEEREVDGAVRVLADPARPVFVLGGRFSHVLAQHLVAYISMLRAGVVQVGRDSGGRMAGIIDVGPRSVVVVYDFRRYQQTSVDWGLAAVSRGAHLIVITDQFLSPLAPRATSLLTCSHVGIGPFDSMTGGFALTEFLFASVARKMGAPARKRLAQFEQFQIQEEKARVTST